MRDAALEYLRCPSCRGELRLEAQARAADGHVMEGGLLCGCGSRAPIRGGVPRFAWEISTTAARFAAQWKKFDHMSRYQEAWLRAWLEPLGPADFAGKTVFEAGCGKGRHTVVTAAWGAKSVVAVDLGEAVDVAFSHTRAMRNVHVVQGDLLRAPVKDGLDVAFSIGVLHHLPDPRAGFDALRRHIGSGGKVAVWVYGRESNEWITRFVDPVRHTVTARLPPWMLYWLSLPPSAALSAVARMVRKIDDGFPGSRIPYGAYLAKLGSVPVREVHNIVFDQLVTPVAHYLPEEEVRSWFTSPTFREVTIAWHNQNSWRASATVV